MNPISWLRRLFASPARKPIRRQTPLGFDTLENRLTPSASPIEAIDGTGNNLAHPDWGSVGTDFLRTAPAAYTDGLSSPAGATRPSARDISNALADQPADTATNDRNLSAFIYAWGQFLDHDLDLTNTTPGASFNIAVPKGDPQFDPTGTGTVVIPLNRSNYDPATGTSNPRQQVNSITSWIDASMVYGSDKTTADSLRTFTDGKLKTSAGNLLPVDAQGNFLAGDVRAAENPELTAIQTLFVREHNRLADQIKAKTPTLSDEEIYQKARAMVRAEIQAITFNEFLPALLGPAAPKPYRGYNPNVNPGIANEFSTAAYRVGHTLVGDDIEFLDNNGNAVRDPMDLKDAFFNPTVVKQTGIDPLLKYLASDNAQEVDTKVVSSLRNFLFGAPGQGGLDLAALNIQRGRDHGLADYNTTRAAYGLPRVTQFSQITSDPALQAQLKSLYKTVDNIDLWVGGLAENHIPGASVGPTFARIIADQFARLRDGDRFWYQNAFSGKELDDLNHTTLASVIKRNTGLTNLQDNVFVFHTSISGRVLDANRQGQANLDVNLLDADGKVVATTKTNKDGGYMFDGLDLGKYFVQVKAPAGQTDPAPVAVSLTKGMDVMGTDVVLSTKAPPPRQTPPPPPAPGKPLPGLPGQLPPPMKK